MCWLWSFCFEAERYWIARLRSHFLFNWFYPTSQFVFYVNKVQVRSVWRYKGSNERMTFEPLIWSGSSDCGEPSIKRPLPQTLKVLLSLWSRTMFELQFCLVSYLQVVRLVIEFISTSSLPLFLFPITLSTSNGSNHYECTFETRIKDLEMELIQITIASYLDIHTPHHLPHLLPRNR